MFTQLGAQRHPSRWDADGCLADDGDSDGDGDGCLADDGDGDGDGDGCLADDGDGDGDGCTVDGVHIDIHSCDGDDGDSSNG